MLRRRIKTIIIPDVLALLNTWEGEGEITAEQASYLRNELNAYASDPSGRTKPYLSLSDKDDKVLKAAVETLTYWNY